MNLSVGEWSLFRGFPKLATRLTAWSASRRKCVSKDQQAGENRLVHALIDTDMYTVSLANDLYRLPSLQFAEQQLIRYGSVKYLRSLQRSPGGVGIEPVLRAKARGLGLTLGCTHIGLFYHAIIQAGSLGDSLMVVTGNQSYSRSVVDRLCELSEVEIKMVDANPKASLALAGNSSEGQLLQQCGTCTSIQLRRCRSPFSANRLQRLRGFTSYQWPLVCQLFRFASQQMRMAARQLKLTV